MPSRATPRAALRRLIAFLIVVNGALDLILALVRELPERAALLQEVLPLDVSLGSRTLTIVAGFVLIMLGRGLARGKRHAWLVAFPLLLGAAVLHLSKDLDVEQAIFALLLAAVLWLRCQDYQAGSDAPSLRRGYAALALGVALATVYSFGGVLVLHRQLHHPVVLRHALRTSLRLLAFQHVHLHHVTTPHAQWFVQSVPVLSAVALVYGMAMILRPAILRSGTTPEDRARMHELVHTCGLNPLAPYALQQDKALFFTATRSAGLAYRVAGEVAVVLGDPIGPSGEVPALLDEFLRFCPARGWHPAFYQVLPATAPLYRARGFKLMKIGEEAVLDLPTFTLSGKRMANARHSVTHAERAGLRVHIYRLADVGEELRTQLAAISRGWLSGKMSAEMRFSMGTFGEALDEETLVAVALDEQGTARAFITLVPMPARQGWMLDLMRRRVDAPAGAMELLIARTVEYLRERAAPMQGAQTFSLSLAALASTHPSDEDTAAVVRRAREFLYEHFDHLYNYRSLQRFKDKFNPRWEERFLAYPAGVPLATVIAAVVRVHLAPRPRAKRRGRLTHGYAVPTRVPA